MEHYYNLFVCLPSFFSYLPLCAPTANFNFNYPFAVNLPSTLPTNLPPRTVIYRLAPCDTQNYHFAMGMSVWKVFVLKMINAKWIMSNCVNVMLPICMNPLLL